MTQEQETNLLKRKIIEALESANGYLIRNNLVKKLDLQFSGDDYKNYKDAEQDLVEEKRIERRPGRRGGIYLLQEDDSQSQTDHESRASAAEESSRKEKAHYELVLQQIEQHWTEEQSFKHGFKHVYVAVTAHQGQRKTGGRWSRPDIILCTVSEWLFLPRPEGEVRTIEIKVFNNSLDVIGVYEALSHKSRSHYAYLMIVDFPEELTSKKQKENFDQIMTVAASHGIGIITVRNSSDWSTWEFVLEPTRSDAGHQEINQFLLDQFPEIKRNEFADKIRQIDGGEIT